MAPDPLGLSVLQAAGTALLGHEVNPQDWDMYAYALGNPVSLTDPAGLNACSPRDQDQTDCMVTVVVADRTRGKNGKYNDQFTNVPNQANYNATATVFVDGKLRGTFLIKTTPSSGKYPTIKAGTYKGFRVMHGHRHPAIQLAGRVPVLGGRDPATGLPYATGIEAHRSGLYRNNTAFYDNGQKPISMGCSVVACTEYPSFESAAGLSAPAPRRLFTIQVESAANGGSR